MIVNCADCDEPMCDCCDGSEIETGVYLCDYCAEEREEEKKEEDPSATKFRCAGCRQTLCESPFEKLPGRMCLKCAHKYEIELLPDGHDAEKCAICTPPAKRAA